MIRPCRGEQTRSFPGNRFLQRRTKELFRVTKASMYDLVHETQYDLNILCLDLVGDLHAFAHQPQNFQAQKMIWWSRASVAVVRMSTPYKIAATLYSKI